ncbi:MAG: hypothetical protein M4D80_12840 [Myxococcota bacterium]|nr:hypothetical protein [Myxococcota bacterium]
MQPTLWIAACFALNACAIDELETADTEQALADPSASYNVEWRGNTWYAWTGAKQIDLGNVPAGTTLRLSTCGASGGWAYGPAYMRLLGIRPGAPSVENLSEENHACPGESGTQMTYTTDVTQRVLLNMGCWANEYCASIVTVSRRFDSNGRMANVVGAFDAIAPRNPVYDRSGYWKNGTLARTDDYHNQGFTRVRVGDGSYGNWFVMSRNQDARLYMIGMGSRSSAIANPLGPNLAGGVPDGRDFVYATLALGAQAGGPAQGSHAGGIQAAGRYLYVPVEGESGTTVAGVNVSQGNLYGDSQVSHVYIVDLRDGWNGFSRVMNSAGSDAGVPRPYAGASAAGVTKVGAGGGRPRDFLMAVGDRNSTRLDFYVQPADSFGFADITLPWQHRFFWQARSSTVKGRTYNYDDSGQAWGDYQSLSLITQTDGSIYMLGTATSSAGWDWADLYRVDSSVYGPNRSAWCGKEFCLTKVRSKTFTCSTNGNEYCSFKGAAGSYFAPDSNRIFVYSDEYYSSASDWQTFMEW